MFLLGPCYSGCPLPVVGNATHVWLLSNLAVSRRLLTRMTFDQFLLRGLLPPCGTADHSACRSSPSVHRSYDCDPRRTQTGGNSLLLVVPDDGGLVDLAPHPPPPIIFSAYARPSCRRNFLHRSCRRMSKTFQTARHAVPPHSWAARGFAAFELLPLLTTNFQIN